MSIELYDTILAEAKRRDNHEYKQHAAMMSALYRGVLPAHYMKYMPKNSYHVIPNMIRNAWDTMAADVGRTPELRAEALDETRAEEKRASLLERIATSYMKDAEPTQTILMNNLAWWLVGTGRSVAVMRPGPDGKPLLSTRDPRTALPNMRTVNNIPVEIFDIIFAKEIPIDEAISLGLAPEHMAGKGHNAGNKMCKVLELIDDEAYTIVSEFGLGDREEHGLKKCPAWVFQTFNPDEAYGLSLYQDQISMMVGVAMLFSMKIAAADKNVNPIYFAKGHAGTVKLGPNVLNKLSPSGEMGRIDPPNLTQVDRDIEMLVNFSNILNKNPEVKQGQVDSKGAYQSAKTLEELAGSLDPTIDLYWDILSNGLKHLLACGLKMDETLWPNVEKRISMNIRGKKFRDTYTPAAAINGHYDINVDYGFGIGGYQGFLQRLQANEAKVLSRKRAMEAMPGTVDVDQEIRQINIESLDEAQMANLQAQAAQGALDMALLAEIKKLVAKGDTVDDAVLKLREEAQAQAQAAAGSEVAPITTPGSTAEEPAAPPAPPGLNPAAVA